MSSKSYSWYISKVTLFQPYLQVILTLFQPYLLALATLFQPYLQVILTLFQPYLLALATLFQPYCCDARAVPFVPQACITARKPLKTGWRGAWYSEVAGCGPCGRPHPIYVIMFLSSDVCRVQWCLIMSIGCGRPQGPHPANVRRSIRESEIVFGSYIAIVCF